ncbi:DUF1127 domain-containing protein [Sneathiella aquimaris]|jgi:uncharacterized protein YjiS (DUF1127 family)|uniref:DUF1127 domain-containing protein n=1 Tax=Sneathiella aquimaris TaxID=2599305 RepID=UPI00146F5268|nr:DUF1127 domain-containing protein [Sneathiella aquimaris]
MSMKTLYAGHSNNFGFDSKAQKSGPLAALTRTVIGWQERASMRYQLAALTEENLNDMGLSFEEVSKETSKYFWQN